MNGVRIVFLILINLLLVVLIPLSILLYSLNHTVLKPYSWDQYFISSGMYKAVSETVPKALDKMTPTQTHGEEQILKDSIAGAVKEVVNPSWVGEKVKFVQNQMWDYILGKTDQIAPIDIHMLRNSMLKQFQHNVASLPLPEKVKNQYLTKMQDSMPTKIDLTTMYGLSNHKLNLMRITYQQAQTGYLRILWFTTILFIIGLILSFYPKSFLRWGGNTLAITGLIMFVIFFGIKKLQIVQYFNRFSIPFEEVKQSVMNLINLVSGIALQSMMNTALLLFIIGVGMIIISFFISKIDQKLRAVMESKPWVMPSRILISFLLFLSVLWMGYQYVINLHV